MTINIYSDSLPMAETDSTPTSAPQIRPSKPVSESLLNDKVHIRPPDIFHKPIEIPSEDKISFVWFALRHRLV